MHELRCNAKLHARTEEGIVEVKCSSRWCGGGPGIVVLHRFSVSSGDLVETKRFTDPARMIQGKEVKAN